MSDEASPDSSHKSSSIARGHFARLRLHHLFALTAVMAVMLTINGPDGSYQESRLPRPLQLALTGYGIAGTILSSIAITTLAYGIGWRRQGFEFFNQPGHWLLASNAVATGMVFVQIQSSQLMLALRESRRINELEFPRLLFVGALSLASIVLMLAVPVIFNIYVARKHCHDRTWSRTFYFKALASVVIVIGHILVFTFLIGAIRNDRREGRQRDTAHWCGVAVELASLVLIFLSLPITIPLIMLQFR